MGRPYANELAELPEVYAWARSLDIDDIAGALARSSRLPMIAVGSGGALSAAALLVQLQRQAARTIAQSTTPLQLASILPADGRVSLWLLSAGGRNEDIRAALRTAGVAEPQQLAVLVGAPQSPLADDARSASWIEALPVELPVRDGFLATSSLVAFATLLVRAIRRAHRIDRELPATLSAFLAEHVVDHERTLEAANALWTRTSLIVLHGVSSACAAQDLESRFTEAALGHVQPADYRNFAHGRHHWLAKHAATSGLLAFESEEDSRLAERTLAPLPRDVPAVRVRLRGDADDTALASLIVSIHLALGAGRARDIDPGRPGVPSFGSRLYRMTNKGRAAHQEECTPVEAAAIRRKARASIASLRRAGALAGWCGAVRAFVERLRAPTFRALVMDYDGTLVEMRERTAPVRADVAGELERLLDEGMHVGIATGRGDSVRPHLLDAIPERYWARVVVGYHNGAALRLLADEPPPLDGQASEAVQRARAALASDDALCRIAKMVEREHQLTVYPNPLTSEGELWLIVAEAVRRAALAVDVVRSSHSVDVIVPGVSKNAVSREIASRVGDANIATLAIGDRGCWPGNDYALLGTPFALSVDEVSPDPAAAWNIAPPGMRGVDALLCYLRALTPAADVAGHRFVYE